MHLVPVYFRFRKQRSVSNFVFVQSMMLIKEYISLNTFFSWVEYISPNKPHLLHEAKRIIGKKAGERLELKLCC